MKKNIRKAIGLFERARHFDSRANAAYIRAGRHPGTMTMDRELAISARWDERADRAWNEAMAVLKSIADISEES